MNYYVAAAISGPYTLDQLKAMRKEGKVNFKFFNEQGFLVGTMYTDGPVLHDPPVPFPPGGPRKPS